MSRSRSGLKDPGKFLFITTEIIGRHLRRYCVGRDLSLSYVLEQALIEHLIKVEEIESREALSIEEQLSH